VNLHKRGKFCYRISKYLQLKNKNCIIQRRNLLQRFSRFCIERGRNLLQTFHLVRHMPNTPLALHGSSTRGIQQRRVAEMASTMEGERRLTSSDIHVPSSPGLLAVSADLRHERAPPVHFPLFLAGSRRARGLGGRRWPSSSRWWVRVSVASAATGTGGGPRRRGDGSRRRRPSAAR